MRPGVLIKTLSHKWGKLNLPTLLFKAGLLTLINMDSLTNHNNQTNHPINHNNIKIIGREGHHLSRYFKESIFIRVNNPTLNNNVGKFNLPHLWDRVLINTPGLKLNK